MGFYSKKLYKLIGFNRSKKPNKKYDAILENKENGRRVHVSFGGIKEDGKPYEQYRDSTGKGLFSKYNHNDKERRARYRKRHAKDLKQGKYSPGYFSWEYLW